MSIQDPLQRLAQTIESRKTGSDEKSYVARLLRNGPDSFLKKIGEEATETVMAAKDVERDPANAQLRSKLVGEVADLWFHSMIALAYFDLSPADVMAELERREGTSGLDEKAQRNAKT